MTRGDASCVVMRQSQSQQFLLRKEIYIEHQNILIHGQDTKNGIRISSGEATIGPFNINYTVK